MATTTQTIYTNEANTGTYARVRAYVVCTRNQTNYKNTYYVQYRRTNTGYTTSGTMCCNWYRNGSYIGQTVNKNVSFSGTSWVTAGTFEETVSLGEYNSTSFTFYADCVQSTTNLTPDNMIGTTPTATVSVPAYTTTVPYSACGKPTSLSITANSNNTISVSAKVGSNGTNNTAQSLDFYVTYNGNTPNTGTYQYTTNISGSAGTTVSATIDLNSWSQSTASSYLGSDYAGPIYVVARTRGSAGSSYYSDCTSTSSATFYWRGKCAAPDITRPSKAGKTCYGDFRVIWANGSGGINNTFSKYTLRVYNNSTGANVATYNTTNSYYNCPSSIFTAGNNYTFYVKTVGSVSGYDSGENSSGTLMYRNIQPFGTVNVTISEGAVPKWGSNIMNIGTGTVATLTWPTPTGTGNEISHYLLTLTDVEAAEHYKQNQNIGLLNTYHIDATEVPKPNSVVPLQITLEAISKYTDDYNSFNSVIYDGNVSMYPSDGMYWKINSGESGYQQDTMKRAIGFIKKNGNWIPVSEMYKKDTSGNWVPSDIQYELLTDMNGEVITDINDEPIYTL